MAIKCLYHPHQLYSVSAPQCFAGKLPANLAVCDPACFPAFFLLYQSDDLFCREHPSEPDPLRVGICKETGKTLQEILDAEGQQAFLEIEKQVVLGLTPEKAVVATGGSVPLKAEAMEHLKQNGTVIYLKVPLKELEQRLSNIKTRGIAFGPGETLETLYNYRIPIYESWADLTIEMDPTRNDIENMVDQIVHTLS